MIILPHLGLQSDFIPVTHGRYERRARSEMSFNTSCLIIISEYATMSSDVLAACAVTLVRVKAWQRQPAP